MKKIEVYHHTKNAGLLKKILNEGLKARKSPAVGANVIFAYLEHIDDFPWVSFSVDAKTARVGNNSLATLYLTSGDEKLRKLYLASIMTLEKYMKRSKLDCEFRSPITALPVTEEELDSIARKSGNYFLYYDPEILIGHDISPTELIEHNPKFSAYL